MGRKKTIPTGRVPPANGERLHTEAEMAKILGISVWRLNRWVTSDPTFPRLERKGNPNSKKVAWRRYFPSQVLRYLERPSGVAI
jgi:hypothetical protein